MMRLRSVSSRPPAPRAGARLAHVAADVVDRVAQPAQRLVVGQQRDPGREEHDEDAEAHPGRLGQPARVAA